MASSSLFVVSRFRSEKEEAAYLEVVKCGITNSHFLVQDKLSYPISDLLIHSSILPLVSLNFPYHSEFVYEFFANLLVSPDHSCLRSFIRSTEISFSPEDFHSILGVSNSGPAPHLLLTNRHFDWTPINISLRNSPVPRFISSTNTLLPNARAVQHIVRSNIIPKAGDKATMTPLISLVTHFILTNSQFNVADLLVRYIDSLEVVRDINFRRKPNLALGHVIYYMFNLKYDRVFPLPPNLSSTPFSDKSFHHFLGFRRHPPPAAAPAEEDVPAPPAQPDISSRLDRIESDLELLRAEVQSIPADTARQLGELRSWFESQRFFPSSDYSPGYSPDS